MLEAAVAASRRAGRGGATQTGTAGEGLAQSEMEDEDEDEDEDVEEEEEEETEEEEDEEEEVGDASEGETAVMALSTELTDGDEDPGVLLSVEMEGEGSGPSQSLLGSDSIEGGVIVDATQMEALPAGQLDGETSSRIGAVVEAKGPSLQASGVWSLKRGCETHGVAAALAEDDGIMEGFIRIFLKAGYLQV